MFNENEWKKFVERQPLFADFAKEMAAQELSFLNAKAGDTYHIKESLERFHDVMESNGILTRTGTLKEDLQKIVNA